MKKKRRIALLMLGVSSTACGGAERFFADFFSIYQQASNTAHELFFFTDPGTEKVLKQLGKLKSDTNVVVLKNVSNRFKRFLESRNFMRQLAKHEIDIVHVSNYNTNYFDRLISLSDQKSAGRTKIVMNIVDCEIPYVYDDVTSPKHAGYKARYNPLFERIKPQAIFTWYELFCTFAEKQNWLKAGAFAEAALTRFADTSGFKPSARKEKQIVYAARLTPQKQPLMFAEAVRILRDSYPDSIGQWKFFIYGSGPLEIELQNFIRSNKLETILIQKPATDLKQIYADSSCFVSTQDYENFPSLSMNEAMAAGNAVIARNVGQTNRFLEDGKNGYFAVTDDAQGIADALRNYLNAPHLHDAMLNHSLYLAREVHTPGNFIKQIDKFWQKVQDERA